MILHFTIQARGAPLEPKFLAAALLRPREYYYANFGLPIASETMYDFIRERIGASPAGWPGFDVPFVRKDAGADVALLRQRPSPLGWQ